MSAAGAASRRTFRSLRQHRNYRLWFAGQIVSATGTWAQNVGQAWFVAVLTHSAIAQGVLVACQFGPYMLLGLFGGALTDRLHNLNTLKVTQAAYMGGAALLAVLALSGGAQVWEVYLIAAFNGAVQVIDTPSRQAFTMEMVGRDELANAVALNSSMFNASRVVGPAIGGLIIATLGVGICFVFNAISFLAVLGALMAMRPEQLHAPQRRSARTSLMRESLDGLHYVWGAMTVRLVMGMMLLVGTIAMNFNVLLPVLTQRTLQSGPETFGWLSAAFGGGALVGALVSATIGRSSRTVLLGGAAAFGLTELLLAPVHTVLLCSLLLFANGIAFSLYTSMSNSAIQMVVPDRLRGRVMGIYGYVFFGTAPIGGLLTGWLASQGGTELAFFVAGTTALVVALAGTLGYHVRRRRSTTTIAGPEVTLARE